ncbi:unnamed protein product [Lepidochelys olivacea]
MLLLQILGVTLLLLAQSAGEQGRNAIADTHIPGSSARPQGPRFPTQGRTDGAPSRLYGSGSIVTATSVGIQLKFGERWGDMYGAKTQAQLAVTLLPGERITQVSGKQYTYVYQLIVSTNKGRIFFFGQPYGNSFNAVPLSCTEYLAFLTGHYSGGSLTGIAMHWAEPRKQE